jgi:hypothetical protein
LVISNTYRSRSSRCQQSLRGFRHPGERTLERAGLELCDPHDARAKRIRFALRGGALALMDGLTVLGEIEHELAQKLGRRRVDELHATLLELLAVLERGEL